MTEGARQVAIGIAWRYSGYLNGAKCKELEDAIFAALTATPPGEGPRGAATAADPREALNALLRFWHAILQRLGQGTLESDVVRDLAGETGLISVTEHDEKTCQLEVCVACEEGWSEVYTETEVVTQARHAALKVVAPASDERSEEAPAGAVARVVEAGEAAVADCDSCRGRGWTFKSREDGNPADCRKCGPLRAALAALRDGHAAAPAAPPLDEPTPREERRP